VAQLVDLRNIVRRDLHDLAKPQEQRVDIDPTLQVYPIPTLGPFQSSTVNVDIDGTPKISGVDYTLFEQGYITFTAPPVGNQIHAVFNWTRFSDNDINQFIQQAIREFSMVHPKLNTRRRTPQVNVRTALLTSPYTPGDGILNVNSTAGYDPRGIVFTGIISSGSIQPGPNVVMYYYTGITATSFTGVSVWTGPDQAQIVSASLTQDDNTVHGWFFDPVVVRDVYTFQGYEPPDAFGIGSGYQDIAYWHWDASTGFLGVEFDFSQLEVGVTGSALVPLDQFQVATGEYWFNPVVDTDVLDVPDYALNPISWLAAALALETREVDRDLAWLEKTGIGDQANPAEVFTKTAASFRKKWTDWVKMSFRSNQYPISRRRIYQL
jgi:hypothetical protein